MAHRKHSAEEWERDIVARQRNVVFPDTVQNEARFWRNLGNRPWTLVTKVGLAVLALFVLGFFSILARAALEEGVGLRAVAVVLLIWGPVFIAIAWATRRALRNIRGSKRNR